MAKKVEADRPYSAPDELDAALDRAVGELRSFYREERSSDRAEDTDESLIEDLFARYRKVWAARRRVIHRDLDRTERKMGMR